MPAFDGADAVDVGDGMKPAKVRTATSVCHRALINGTCESHDGIAWRLYDLLHRMTRKMEGLSTKPRKG